ncbi:MAG: signal peptidase I [candidate division Zixibacteria bacterium]|nr:signal peptidase I [candidate division Zixibacteria bacterium]
MHPRMVKIAREVWSFGVTVVVLLGARSSLADHYTVPTGSMEYTLMPGDRIVVNKMAYGIRVPFTDWKITEGPGVKRGEVAIFDSPDDGVRLVKRIVAVAGDSVRIHEGQLFINGKPLTDDRDPPTEVFGERRAKLNLVYGGGNNMGPARIPKGYLFVVGDARGNSRDSRIFGPIAEAAVYGRALAVYYRSGDGLCWLKL